MSSNEDFFREKRAAAVFKHGILKRYPVVFASKAGQWSPGQRVVFLDGYAGRGRYKSGDPGSPLLLAQCAEYVSNYRNVTGIFVEKDPEHFANLKQVMDELGDGFHRRLFAGDLGEHLTEILAEAKGAPLFAFLDPFGTALDRERLVRDLLGRSRPPATEVLLHFSVSTVARIGGLVRKVRHEGRVPNRREALTIGNVDRFLGGAWWQHYFETIADEQDIARATDVALSVADEFCRSVGAATGYISVAMPVRLRPDQLPKYVLVLFTRSYEGVWQFADALGKAGLDWHEAWRAADEAKEKLLEEKSGQFSLFEANPAFDRDAYLDQYAPSWVAAIESNIKILLAKNGPVRLAEHTAAVYGDTLGSAWIRHVKRAVKSLYAAGIVNHNGIGDRFHNQPIALVNRAPLS